MNHKELIKELTILEELLEYKKDELRANLSHQEYCELKKEMSNLEARIYVTQELLKVTEKNMLIEKLLQRAEDNTVRLEEQLKLYMAYADLAGDKRDSLETTIEDKNNRIRDLNDEIERLEALVASQDDRIEDLVDEVLYLNEIINELGGGELI